MRNWRHRVDMLANYKNICLNDETSIVYHTRVFDSLILDHINNVKGKTYSWQSCMPESYWQEKPRSLFETIRAYCPILEIPIFICTAVYSSNMSFIIYFYSELCIFINNIFPVGYFKNILFPYFDTLGIFKYSNVFEIYELSPVENFIDSLLPNNNFLDYCIIKEIDIFMFISEYILIILFFTYVIFMIVTSEYLQNSYLTWIINSIKASISLTEFITSITLAIGFILITLFSSLSYDPHSEFIIFYLAFAIVFVLLFISIIQDIFNFYTVSNISGNNLSIKILIYDVIYNFINFFRIFLSWIRYIFYDIQLEGLDFSSHYIDYDNEYHLLSIFNDNETAPALLFYLLNKLNYLLIFFLDIFFLILLLILNIFKIFMALYIFWLIIDLFIIKIFCLKEFNLKQK